MPVWGTPVSASGHPPSVTVGRESESICPRSPVAEPISAFDLYEGTARLTRTSRFIPVVWLVGSEARAKHFEESGQLNEVTAVMGDPLY